MSSSNGPKVGLELDHFFGLNPINNSVQFHPNGINYIYATGGNIVIGDLNNPHVQGIMSGHNDYITCIAVSNDGSMIASGQRGKHL
jgi:WD40 repeat protein